MPEGPEVTIIADQLRKHLRGKTVVDFIVHGNLTLQKTITAIRSKINFPIVIIDVKKRGKFLYFWFKDKNNQDLFLGNALGLSGHWRLAEINPDYKIMTMKMNSDNDVVYSDKRHFGKFYLMTLDELNQKLDEIGPDMLLPLPRPDEENVRTSDTVGEDKFLQRIKKYPAKQIVQVLMDQKVISGIGNYVKAESLYHAGVYPGTLVGDISDDKLRELFRAVVKVLTDSYSAGGVSVQDYYDVYGNVGAYKPIIYKQKKDQFGKKISTKTFKDGRSTYYVA